MASKELRKKANLIRQDIINMVAAAGSGHPAGALGMADIFAALYFKIAKINPKRPNWPDRDRIFLSNGHICPVLYATLARRGYFKTEELATLRRLGSRLQGHPHRTALPGVENTSGPLGQGLGQACGSALAARLNNKKYHVYCVMSDGEQDCGSTWEAAMFAGKNRLSNITAIMDRNNIQIDGYTEDVMPLEPLRQKYESFNWRVIEVDGHNLDEFIGAANRARKIEEKPVMIIAHTVPGKGVSFMEYDYRWHGKAPNGKEAKKALKGLNAIMDKLK
ncbi:transketolase [Patescibacteria group bacterium]|nr:transketolase [Patescibacteria group bacterium]MBU1922488.1 transketolase [Patescibacteria group bacterium]